MDEIILPEYAGEVIKVGDQCYRFESVASSAPTHEAPDSTYGTCEECQSPSGYEGSASATSTSNSSTSCDFVDCYEFTFTNLANPAYLGADQQYVENGTFNGYPAFQGQTDPDWWLLYGTVGSHTGWLLQKSGSSPDTGGYTTIYGTTDCTEGNSNDRVHPCPEGGFCHDASAGDMAKGCS